MNQTQRYCKHCRAKLEPGQRFCGNCGQTLESFGDSSPAPQDTAEPSQVAAQPAWPPPPPPPSPVFPSSDPAAAAPVFPLPSPAVTPERKNISLTWLWVTFGVIGLLGLCLFVALSIGAYGLLDRSGTAPVIGAMPTQAVQIIQPTAIAILPPTEAAAALPEQPIPTNTLIPEQPNPSNTPIPPNPSDVLTGMQMKEPEYIFDDFSSPALGWDMENDEFGERGIVNEAYSIRVLNPGDTVYSEVPIELYPNHIEFDALVAEGLENGGYGVVCMYQDDDNYFEVSINPDPAYQDFEIYQVQNNELIQIVEPTYTNSFNYYEGIDHIMIDCTLGGISVWINDQVVYDQIIMGQQGEMFLYTYSWLDATGPVEVLFDNLEVWKQMQ